MSRRQINVLAVQRLAEAGLTKTEIARKLRASVAGIHGVCKRHGIACAEGRNKHGAKRVAVDGIVFASGSEARRWGELQLLERVGEISRLERQIKYDLAPPPNFIKVCSVIWDFRYWTDKQQVIEDSKGYATPIYRLKRKLFQALYPHIEFREVKAR